MSEFRYLLLLFIDSSEVGSHSPDWPGALDPPAATASLILGIQVYMSTAGSVCNYAHRGVVTLPQEE